MASSNSAATRGDADRRPEAPSVSLPKGGGAIRGVGEKFGANPVTGTGGMTVPLGTSPGRSGFGPSPALSYDSGAGNGPFGYGWALGLGAITRKTERGLPRYRDAEESDVFLLAGSEDLVPVLDAAGVAAVDAGSVPGYSIASYRPRIEGGWSRIERWTRKSDADVHWRVLSGGNVLTIYGRDARSRIADPADARRIFSWLVCESRDDRGNAIIYEYKAEDATGVDTTLPHEHNRGDTDSAVRTANRYPKRIRYGNRVPLLDASGRRPIDLTPELLQAPGWMFDVVFDYGEHDANAPTPEDGGAWVCRHDPYSSYRAGFEVRTYRLCQRVLMFHHFPAEAGVGANCLVRSTDFAYRETRGNVADRRQGHPTASFLASVAHRGYIRADSAGYTSRSLPPVTFEYSRATIDSRVRELDAGNLENLPAALADVSYRWVDLDGEGLPGILAEQASAWFYKPNLGDGKLGPLKRLETLPSLADLTSSRQQLMDVDSDGRIDLVQLATEPKGFFERSAGDGWERFQPFSMLPTVDWASPNLRLIDLTGDGRPDLLLTDAEAFTWHPSLGEAGFGEAQHVSQAVNDDHGPRLVLADGTETIFLADMSGDGLADIVRIRNGDVCYWPNLGYGRFGSKVTMRHAPVFDRPDRFDPRRIRLADVDGSGVADILYVGAGEIRLWFNQSGNGWSVPHRLPDFPHVDSHTVVDIVDLLGNGTACVVWSSPLPADASSPLRYVDLMGGTKPHLLVRVENNLGAETRIHYAASTKFYLSDRAAGRPWITRLPFPVHVVERVEQIDHVSRVRFAARYSYHHGYFDGVEREFRGFGMVEQADTEAFEDHVVGVAAIGGNQELAPELNQPPVTTRTWFHTGAYRDGDRILHQMRDEYHRGQQHLPDPVLPAGMDSQEFRECVRALRGRLLRQEVYSFDGSSQAAHPYSVVEHAYDVRRVQPRARGQQGVFAVNGAESVTLHYERDLTDPRIAHGFSLAVGPYGNVLESASVVYGRSGTNPLLPAEVTRDQQRLYVTCVVTDYTPDIDRRSPVPAYRLRTPCEARGYEITGIAPAAALFTRSELRAGIAGATSIAYEDIANGAIAQKRPLSHSRTLFRDNALAPMGLGAWDTLALGYESYQLAFTPSVIAAHYGTRVADAEFSAAGYVHFDGDADWWIPSGTAVYPASPAAHFYLAVGARDPLGLETVATLDQYDLLPERTVVTQAAWSEVRVVNDYRVLGPVMLTDPNQNRAAVEMDELGMVVKSAVMGKAGAGEGDTLADPTARLEYDLFNWMNNGKPSFVHTFAREQHGAANPRWQESYAYSNGGGGVAMVKAQAHPGKALRPNADGTVTEVDADPRWIGNGRTIVNNKGNPVKSYEPYFSTTHEYEDEEALRTIGSTPVMYYDAVGRNVRTVLPNGTFARVEFDSWMQRTFDVNDTVLASRWYAERGSPDPNAEAEPVNDPERRTAWLTAKHAGTPGVVHLDSLGRPVYAVADYGGGKTAAVRSERDLTGRLGTLFDQAQRRIAEGFVGMSGIPISTESAEKGRRWSFLNVLGAAVKIWDEHGRAFRNEYDVLHRLVTNFATDRGTPETALTHVFYGDRHPNGQQRRLLGVPHLFFDQAGMVRIPEMDFSGNPTRAERVFASNYKVTPNWRVVTNQVTLTDVEASAALQLDAGEVFTTTAAYDALRRPTLVTLPDATVLVPKYNQTGSLLRLDARVGGQGALLAFLQEQDYDAKGQRQFARYGNGVITRYFHDAKTFRLTRLLTYRANPAADALQDLRYAHDPVGNITQVGDEAQQTLYFNNAVVRPESQYEYDAIYQLIRATGREHAGMPNDALRDEGDIAGVDLPHPNDAHAIRTYTEEYDYDLLGNITALRHRYKSQIGIGVGWTRHYRYGHDTDPADRTNRLKTTSAPGDSDTGPYSASYAYDEYGNMTTMPHLAAINWDALDQLREVNLGGGGTAYYVYGAGGQRMRKVIERIGGLRVERIYLGALEIHRRRFGDAAPHFERRTVYIADERARIAQVDIKTRDDNDIDPANPIGTPLVRYQHGNHLGSATLETNDLGAAISYEEYHPFGTAAYRSGKPASNLTLKQYRFSGKERDDETGLYYSGARYYAPWLARWTSSDPAGFIDGCNVFVYARNNPITLGDPSGLQAAKPPEYTVEWSGDDRKLSKTERKLLTNPRSDPAKVLEVFRKQGYQGEGPLQWVGEGWLDTSAKPSAVAEKEESGGEENRSSQTSSLPPPVTPTEDTSSPTAASDVRDAASIGTPLSQAAPAAERFIWQNYDPKFRGKILEWLYGVPWGSNTKDWDLNLDTKVQQIKSTNAYDTAGDFTRSATRQADSAITANPNTMGGKRPQPVMITPTDAPTDALREIDTALQPGNGRKIPANSLPPERVRGLPGTVGAIGKVFTVGGFGLSIFGFGADVWRGDVLMAPGSAISAAGGVAEVYALASPGAMVAGVSAVTAGLVMGGVGLSLTSAVSGVRAWQRGDTPGAIAGVAGVLGGAAMVAGVAFSAPALLVGGLIVGAGVGLFHLCRWLSSD